MQRQREIPFERDPDLKQTIYYNLVDKLSGASNDHPFLLNVSYSIRGNQPFVAPITTGLMYGVFTQEELLKEYRNQQNKSTLYFWVQSMIAKACFESLEFAKNFPGFSFTRYGTNVSEKYLYVEHVKTTIRVSAHSYGPRKAVMFTKKNKILVCYNNIFYTRSANRLNVVNVKTDYHLNCIASPLYGHHFKQNMSSETWALSKEEYRKKYLKKIHNKKALKHIPWDVLKPINKYMRRSDIDKILIPDFMKKVMKRIQGYTHLSGVLIANVIRTYLSIETPTIQRTIVEHGVRRNITVNVDNILHDLCFALINRGRCIPLIKSFESYIRLHDQYTIRNNIRDPLKEIHPYPIHKTVNGIIINSLDRGQDFIDESDIMHHCVVSYANRTTTKEVLVYNCKFVDSTSYGYTVGLKKTKNGYVPFQFGGLMNSQPTDVDKKEIIKTLRKELKQWNLQILKTQY